MDNINIVFDLQDGKPKLVKGNVYRFEVRIGGMRVYGFRYDPSTGKVLLPQSEDRTGRKHRSADISQELENQIISIIKGGKEEEGRETDYFTKQNEPQVDEVVKKHLEETEKLRKEYNESRDKRSKVQ